MVGLPFYAAHNTFHADRPLSLAQCVPVRRYYENLLLDNQAMLMYSLRHRYVYRLVKM